ncbi:head GIN domain-containing protein [Cellulophaga omnivescoria]|uniref:head GIN domain-containing protein n=1 Tax=Cellulophaga omnivescoria TaxID=1888890 RepID=UPI0009858DD8|nr:head GIN domain-containing protein [Cellulophaga omnivescoria]WBU89594.1 DUF2807 domain-containing protein [Cellulophaga omnivescoria]WKB81618.1 head GIN domain-containing protein [Cellulophaga lytica]
MKKILTLSLALTLAFTANAQWGKRVKGNGNIITDSRNVGDYEAISVSGFFDVELIEGTEGKITLKGDENILNHIKTEVKNGKLVIKAEKGMNLSPSRNSKLLVTVPVEHINEATLSGSGDIVGKTTIVSNTFETSISGSGDINLKVKAKELKATMSGSGDINLSGSATDFTVRVSGSGDISAYDLEADYVKALVSGSADIKVTAKETIDARVSGSGDIKYRGNPKKIESKTSGSGGVSKG